MLVYRVELKASAIMFKSRTTDKPIFNELRDAPRKSGKSKELVGGVKVESVTRMGPYCGSRELPVNACRWLREHGLNPMVSFYYDEIRHPDPYEDVILRKNIEKGRQFTGSLSSLFYGFESIESLSRWFDFYIRDQLHRAGYAIMVYEAEEVYTGECQLVFNPETALPVKIIHLDEFETIYHK